jgi:hypothetical protein
LRSSEAQKVKAVIPKQRRGSKRWSTAGQATVEYIILLSVVVGLFLLFARAMRPWVQKLGQTSEVWIDQLFGPGNMHQLKIGK